MKNLLIVTVTFLIISCQKCPNELFNNVSEIAQLDKKIKPILIKSGLEEGFLEPLMEYEIYKLDSNNFKILEKKTNENKSFKQGAYYLNIELDDYIQDKELKIKNMSKSLVSNDSHQNTHYLYLLSDQQTFAICKVNH